LLTQESQGITQDKTRYCFRDHLEDLERNDLLIKVTKSVDPKFEIPALIRKATKLEKAIIFSNVKDKDHSIVANVAGSRRMISLALSMDKTQSFLKQLAGRISTVNKPGRRLVKTAPVQEIVEEKDYLPKLPLLTHFERDAGEYITAGTVIAKDRDSGFVNASFNRMMLRPDLQLGIRMMSPQHLGIIQNKAEAEQRDLEVAVVLGNHPAEMLASASLLAFGEDHLDHASSLRGAQLETVRCKTVDIEVPASAEIIVEGEVKANVREEEGPFGEFMDYYVEKGKNHVMKVKAITHRSDYIYQGLLCGSKEDLCILSIARELRVFNALIAAGYDVKDFSLMPFLFNGIMSIRKRFEGEPKNAMMTAFGFYSWLKYCVAVDPDVDIHNLEDVWWAIGTRSIPEKGLFQIQDAMGFPRTDVSAIHRGKVGLDATVPIELRKEFERKRIPNENEINLSKYL
jgi:2,5-furandicarboxylate decarboxylase 1